MDQRHVTPPWHGSVVTIHVAEAAGTPMVEQAEANAIAGRGIEGDRYFTERGFYSWFKGPIREISLIEEEVIERLAADHNITLAPGETRRNIVTRGVPLGHLVGRTFQVGEATLRGVEICEPCGHLVDITGNRAMLSALIHRGGLHAEIVGTGIIRPGDRIAPLEENDR